ncbi:hypothetical protein LAZ67_4001583 [Cordylochernes scorpioides]|uniref:Uncharacterized protein n=1 Tax=Cordylochernes scorpioides TaxID=51811 RepID=A0ABY6KD50_9ARAC|nr:hypothetical protein LAZ67_4001583 [Cordylochernes scorpioides]
MLKLLKRYPRMEKLGTGLDIPADHLPLYDPSFKRARYPSSSRHHVIGSEFLGKRMGSEFLGKRMGSEFLGKRMGSEFLGKRMGSEFLGKRSPVEFVDIPKNVDPEEFLESKMAAFGKSLSGEYNGRMSEDDDSYLEKRMGSEFLGKRMGSEFLGRRRRRSPASDPSQS